MLAYVLYTVFTCLAVLPLVLYARNPYIWTDVCFAYVTFTSGFRVNYFGRRKPFFSILDRFLQQARRLPHKKFVLFEDRSFTYSDADRESNKAARALQAHGGLKEGDTVALMVGNEPNFLWMWLGLSKLGCPVALLNTNIRSKSLLHCFSFCGAKTLVAAADLQAAVEEVLPALTEQGVRIFILSDECHVDGLESLSDKIRQASDEPLPRALRANVQYKSPAVYIYTSGTTGLPKAAIIKHDKLWLSSIIQTLAGVRSDDVIYMYLPLYHSAGFLMGLCGTIDNGYHIFGAAVVADPAHWQKISRRSHRWAAPDFLRKLPKG